MFPEASTFSAWYYFIHKIGGKIKGTSIGIPDLRVFGSMSLFGAMTTWRKMIGEIMLSA